MKGILLSASYQEHKAVLKFYDPETKKVILWKDPTNHLPHCYVTPEIARTIQEWEGIHLQDVNIQNVLEDDEKSMVLVRADNPLIISGGKQALRDACRTWESDIKYYQTYLYDNNLIVGKWYEIGDNITAIDETTKQINLGDIDTRSVIDVPKFLEYVKRWAALLDEPIPKIRRLAFDIEVESTEGLLPDPSTGNNRVTAISFDSDDISKVFILNRPEMEQGQDPSNGEYIMRWFESEKEMLEEAFKIIESYPLVLTYNGDMFDMPYLYNRAIKLGISYIPLKMMAKNATIANAIHIDLYGFFSNHSMQVYTFNSKYSEHGLEAVSAALLNEHKLSWEGDFNKMPLLTLAKYCYNDARLTYKLSHYNDDMVMNLLIILARISNMPIDDISRLSISHWLKSMIYFKHRQNEELIPRADDFPIVEASTKAMIEGKKYEGAMVLDPVKGIHFDVNVMDFASLYPSIIKTKNISYETVRCSHVECRENKIPLTNHWVCNKKIGTYPLLLGTLKEVRVGHFKKLERNETDKNKKEQYNAITQAIKVFLVAGYGVVGFESFPLYFLPTAESITAYGRSIIQDTMNEAKKLGMTVIAGDTDSMFVKQPTKKQIEQLIQYARDTYKMDLESDKEYRYVVLSNRKKNYFGVKKDGTLDIKGLTGKKSHTPPFIKKLFTSIMDYLKLIEKPEDFEQAKITVSTVLKQTVNAFDTIPLEELAFKMSINKELKEYKVKPQAVIAAQQLGKEVKKGQFVSFVKTWNEPGVKPLQLVQRKDVDKEKYLESLQTTLEQVTDPMDISIDEILGKGRQTTLF